MTDITATGHRLSWHGIGGQLHRRPFGIFYECQSGRIPPGWLLSYHSQQGCSWLRQVASVSRAQRVKTATCYLHAWLLSIHPPVSRISTEKLGLSKPRTQSRCEELLLCWRGPLPHPQAPWEHAMENSHQVIKTEWGGFPE